MVGRSYIATLTPREREVFDLVIRGNPNKQSRPRALGCTVRTHQGSSPQGDGETAGSVLAGTCIPLAERIGVASAAGPTAADVLPPL